MTTQNLAAEEPEFISFLFSSKLKHDCVFLVGNKNHMKPERIGVVKAMLMAHSVVLRLELEDSKLAEKGEVAVPDVYPDTFRILLRYVYGQDTTAALCFDEADNLLYVAEKYMMGTLKKKLATRLMSLLNTKNICSLLNNPACYRELELNSAITEILRYETDRVLASPMFLDLSPDGFVKILEQDGLNVPEIELWRAMMKWAKHNANSEDGKALRKQVSKLTEHIRICSLNTVQLCQEVATTDVLTDNELALVCKSVGQQEKHGGLTEFCNEITPRVLLQKKPNVNKPEKKQQKLKFTHHHCAEGWLQEFNFIIKVTDKCGIELLPLECLAPDPPEMSPEDVSYYVCCVTRIQSIDHFHTPTEAPVDIRFVKGVEYGTTYKIPLISGGHNVTLLPNNMYTFRMVYYWPGYRDNPPQLVYWDDPETSCYKNRHVSLKIQPNEGRHYPMPMKRLKYKTVDDDVDYLVPMKRMKYEETDA